MFWTLNIEHGTLPQHFAWKYFLMGFPLSSYAVNLTITFLVTLANGCQNIMKATELIWNILFHTLSFKESYFKYIQWHRIIIYWTNFLVLISNKPSVSKPTIPGAIARCTWCNKIITWRKRTASANHNNMPHIRWSKEMHRRLGREQY